MGVVSGEPQPGASNLREGDGGRSLPQLMPENGGVRKNRQVEQLRSPPDIVLCRVSGSH